MGTGNRVSLLYLGEAVDHGLYDRLLQCVAAAQAQRRTAAKCGRAGLLENSKDGGLKHLTTTDLKNASKDRASAHSLCPVPRSPKCRAPQTPTPGRWQDPGH